MTIKWYLTNTKSPRKSLNKSNFNNGGEFNINLSRIPHDEFTVHFFFNIYSFSIHSYKIIFFPKNREITCSFKVFSISILITRSLKKNRVLFYFLITFFYFDDFSFFFIIHFIVNKGQALSWQKLFFDTKSSKIQIPNF